MLGEVHGMLPLHYLMEMFFFEATVDPTNAPANTFMHDVNGNASREVQKYSGALKVTKVGKKVNINGDVEHGVVTININMARKNED